jgi:DNA-binding response OmpR family regulator
MTVLLLARYRELGLFRVHVLEEAGLKVIFPEHEHAAVRAINQGSFDVILLSYSLPSTLAEELIELCRQKCPKCPVVAISEKGWEDRKLQPDDTVLASEGPQGMLDAIHRVMRNRLRLIK